MAACPVAASNTVPHSPQNFASAGFWAPQLGHPDARRAPHSMQNLRPTSFSVLQLAQITAESAYQRSGAIQRDMLKVYSYPRLRYISIAALVGFVDRQPYQPVPGHQPRACCHGSDHLSVATSPVPLSDRNGVNAGDLVTHPQARRRHGLVNEPEQKRSSGAGCESAAELLGALFDRPFGEPEDVSYETHRFNHRAWRDRLDPQSWIDVRNHRRVTSEHDLLGADPNPSGRLQPVRPGRQARSGPS